MSSPSKIIFSVTEPAPNHIALLKGIPDEPIHRPIDQQVLFGRGHGVGVFLNDDTASREHMKLSVQMNPATGENLFVVKTVSTSKPVYINGNPQHQHAVATVLKTNDKLNIGQLEFVVTVIPGDSIESYQVEFTRMSRVSPQQHNVQVVNTPQPKGGINSEQIIVANQLGAVILPGNFGVPANPAFNMNISAMGGASQFGAPVAPFHGMPMASTHQPMPVNAGMGQFIFQPHPTHPRFQSPSPCFQPCQESSDPGVYTPPLHQQASAQDKREMYHAKQPSEQSEDPKETEPDDGSHVSIQETGQQKKLQ